ncbi:c-type cytochrome [Lysobacter korlensis]|uniref:C-type cytochrome n=1 Tax=Lysobacter korlensis TaxID=553636 RepID=A0ABV6RHA6_9GAMM
MHPERKHLGAGLLIGIIVTLLALLLIALTVAYTGAYNVAASRDHTAGVHWLLDTTMRSSVRSRAPEVADTQWLARADVAAGAGEYKAMCEHCHGGPGADPAEWSRGMLPRPPLLVEEADEWEPGEVFWIVKHGLKYTGMPSFGETHDDATLWNIAAFVERLPAMTPEQYRAFGPAHAHGPQKASDPHGGAAPAGAPHAHGAASEQAPADPHDAPHEHGPDSAEDHH